MRFAPVAAVILVAGCAGVPRPPPVDSRPAAPGAVTRLPCAPTCYPAEEAPPPGCDGPVSCESKGHRTALALNVVSFRLNEAEFASAAHDAITCQAAARSLVVAGRGLSRANASSPRVAGDFVTRDGQRWTEEAARNAVTDLVEQGRALYAQCGGSALTTTAAEELAFYGLERAPGLDVQQVKAIAIDPPKRVCPEAEVRVFATLEVGGARVKLSQSEELVWSASAGTVDATGLYRLPEAPAALLKAAPVLRVQLAGRPELSAQLPLKPDFSCPRVVDLSGAPGARGVTGTPAESFEVAMRRGFPAMGESGTPFFPGPGGTGGEGAPGAAVEVFITRVLGPSGPLALVRVAARGRSTLHLLEPAGPPLVIDASGGDGGAGGEGGAGRDGFKGEDIGGLGVRGRIRRGADGEAGEPGGPGGRGGNGGAGGKVTVHFDQRHPALKSAVNVLNGGGAGGRAGSGGHGGEGGLGGFGTLTVRRFGGGPSGDDGADGIPGFAGMSGGAGRAGPATTWVPGDAAAMFAAELAAGVTLAP